jgi:hypothetical protein
VLAVYIRSAPDPSLRGSPLLVLVPKLAGRLIRADLNPNEQIFAKLKHLLRKAAARAVEALVAAIGKLPTPPRNAQTTSPTPAINQLKFIPL